MSSSRLSSGTMTPDNADQRRTIKQKVAQVLTFTNGIVRGRGRIAMMRRRIPNLVLFWLALLALAGGRAFLPSGWMPVAGETGVRIALCTGSGPVVAWIDDKGRVHKDSPDDQSPKDHCPFGVLAHGAALPSLPALAAVPPNTNLLPVPLPQVRPMARAYAPRPPTRGPPALV